MQTFEPRSNLYSPRQARARFNSVILGCAGFLFLILFAAGFSTWDHSQKLFEARKWVLHTYEVMRALDKVVAVLSDAQNAAYGFRLTRNQRYLHDFEGTEARALSALDQSSELTADNPLQQSRLKQLRPVVRSKFASLERILKAHPSVDPRLVNLLTEAYDREDMEHVRTVIAQIKSEEERLLADRLQTLTSAREALTSRLMLCGFLALAGFIISSLIVRYLLKRQEYEQQLQQVVFAVSQALVSGRERSEAIEETLAVIGRELSWDVVQFWSKDDDGSKLTCEFSWSGSHDVNATSFGAKLRGLSFEKSSVIAGQACEKMSVVSVKDITVVTESAISSVASSHNIHGIIAIPINDADNCIGVIELFRTAPLRDFDLMLMRCLSSVGAQLGQFLSRTEIAKRLSASERKFKAIFDHTFEFIGLLTPDGTLIEANQTALSFIDKKREDVIGLPFWDTPWWSHSALQQEQLKLAIQAASAGDLVRFESEHPAPDGMMLAVDFSLKPIKNDDGEVILLIPEGRDISEKKEAEKRVSEFYSTVSHELRTPLTSIRGAFGLLEGGKAGDLSEKAKRLVSMGRAESDRLVRLINDILDIRKIEAGKLDLKLEMLCPSDLIESTLDNLRTFASEAHVSLRCEIIDGTKVLGDRDRLVQVLTNLVSNAVKFSPSDSEVLIRANRKENVYRIEVLDHGAGIGEEDLKRLFQMFQQIDSSDSRQKGGTGLGLAISRAIVEQHLGRIGVDSQLGKGSTFWFELPLSAVSPSDMQPAKVDVSISSGVKHGTVLLVEDDANIADVISMNLSNHGFDIQHVDSLGAAEKSLSDKAFDGVILDINLPDGKGTDFIDKLHTSSSTHIPIVVVSAQEQNKFSSPLLIDWISKPFEEKRLLSAVEVAVRKRPAGPARVLVAEDDDATREIIKQHVLSLGAGIQCFEASDGQKAIELTREHEPDLIILDLGLPNTNGFEVVTVLRHEKAARTPLLVYTAQDLSPDERKKLTLGLTTHFTKSKTSEQEFIKCLVDTLNGLVSGEQKTKH